MKCLVVTPYMHTALLKLVFYECEIDFNQYYEYMFVMFGKTIFNLYCKVTLYCYIGLKYPAFSMYIIYSICRFCYLQSSLECVSCECGGIGVVELNDTTQPQKVAM